MVALRGVVVLSPGGWTRQGGIEAHARSIATALPDVETGIYTDVLDSRGNGSLIMSLFFALKSAFQLLGLKLRGKIDVAHVQVSERGSFVRKFFLVRVARLLGLRVILHHHGAEAVETYATAPGWLKSIVRSLTSSAHVNVVLGQQWADWLTNTVGIPKDRVQIIYNGIPDIEQDTAPGVGSETFKPLLLAVLSDRKGVGDFLHALAMLKQRGIPFDATIAGGGPDLPRFETMAEELGIADNCSFPGWVQPADVPATMSNHHCYVLPSYKEGLPIGILEAMRAARPVIATDVGSISEAMPADRGINLITPGDHVALADQLARLANDPALRDAEGVAARTLYLERFTLEQHIQKLLTLYRAQEQNLMRES